MTDQHHPGGRPGDSGAAAPPHWLGHLVDSPAASTPDATALMVGAERRRVTYAQLAGAVRGLSELLTSAGLRPGDVVALQSTNSLEFVVGLLGAARAGLVVAPLDGALPAAERQARLAMAGARVTLVDARQPDEQEIQPTWLLESSAGAGPVNLRVQIPARPAADPVPGLIDDDALIMFTSGTTGRPKMVPWTHANIAASVGNVIRAYQLGSSDGTVAVMPLFHGHGLIAALLATLASGGRLLLPAAGRFSAGTFWDDAGAVGATWYTAVPTIHQILLERAGSAEPAGLPCQLRFVRSCSAPLAPATVRELQTTFGAPVLAAYGMTEATHQTSTVRATDDESLRSSTVGVPADLAVRIVDEAGQDRPAGVPGEISFSGPTVVRGYINNPTATASTFVDGWLRTGDLGTLDEQGALSIRGRIKEQINRGGEKISPEHVEEVLASHPDVVSVAVFGTPDALYGERVAALVVTRDARRPDLASYAGSRLASFEIPEQIAFADELPLTAKGSVNRAKAAAQFLETQPGPG